MDKVKTQSLNWALTHILRFGDTDIFPVPFEYDAIKHNWDGIRDVLANIDISSYECRSLQRFPVLKPQGGYRVAIQLDPLDTLLYSALVYEAAELIERHRFSKSRRIACSYRLQIDEKGQLFQPKNGWDDFQEKSQELANIGKYNYVVLADIADFYNQIGHHRVRNALESANVLPDRAANIENFLMNLTRGHSRGIPVGPSASILLAEACLNDVDEFLSHRGYVHTRYVDDFRVFCKSRSEAFQVLHDLSEYLYTAHRLSLQAGKTEPVSVSEFIREGLHDPEKLEEQRKTEKIKDILNQLAKQAKYGSFSKDDIPSAELRKIVRRNLAELFDACLSKTPLHLGLARYLLRRATESRTDILQRIVLTNLEILAPVMRDVANYLIRTIQQKNAREIGTALISFTQNSDIAFSPFIRLWMTHILIENLASEFEDEIYRICYDTRYQLGARPLALLARNLQHLDWVREQKETWQNNSPWDRRAIIWSAKALSGDERKYWLKRVQNAGDILEKAVATTVMAGI